MISKLLDTPTIGVLERTLSFTEQRHKVILENLANVSTPGYVQKAVSVKDFQKSLGAAIDKQRSGFNTPLQPRDTRDVSFDGSAVRVHPTRDLESQPFYDGGAHSMEKLMGDLADNGEAHNMVASFLKSRYDMLRSAISMRV